jgi:curved DNA-binding protein CbpA
MQNPYRILGVPVGASHEQVWRAYERLTSAFNPDRYADLAQWARAQEQYRAIETAYQILGDPAVRRAYDQCRTRRQRRRFPRTWKKLRRFDRNSTAIPPPTQPPSAVPSDTMTTSTLYRHEESRCVTPPYGTRRP